MTPRITSPFNSRRLVGAVASLALLAGLAFAVAPAATASDTPCVGDACDGGAWAAARGPMNDVSYWGMSAGHNCTNYVAWRLIQAGIGKPATHPGNAADWADNAILDGYLVDDVPTVGAVAHWGAADGYGGLGHVAFIERINDDGTLLISEDRWRNGAQTGPLTYRTVDAESVSNFIHYGDERAWLRTASVTTGGWVASSTHLDIEPTAMAALATEHGVEIFYAQNGRLWQASEDDDGWTAIDTGLDLDSPSLSAVAMEGRPYVMSIDDGELVMSVRTESGWQQMVTGVGTAGELAAVNLGGLTPTVFVSDDNRLWRVWGDPDGWHVESTEVRVTGPIAVLVDDVGRPVVFNVRNGALYRHWFDWSGWQTEHTAVTVDGKLSAVQTLGEPEIFLLEDDTVYRVRPDGGIWITTETGLDGGSSLSVVDQGTADPLAILVG